jgi:GT2 family glycosyltransferase
VAGGWNAGTKLGLDWGAEYCICLANDTEAEPHCVQNLLTFGMSREDGNPLAQRVALWSGTANNDGRVLDPEMVGEGADFSFFAFRPETIQRHGWFDEMFRPAYFEDNDYAARIVLGGEHHRYVYGARFYHHVSMTARNDAEMAHHINHWFGVNQNRFVRKWGRPPVGDEATMLRDYHRTPFNSGEPLSWWGPA